MDKKLQDELYKKYPKIFKQKDMPMQQTAMCWGISCGNGWYDLIDELCCQIQNRVENVNRNRKYKIENGPKTTVPIKYEELVCEAVQVKEKFGGLCFYIYGGDDFIDGVISLAEALSYKTCIECGNIRQGTTDRGWIHALCSNCSNKKLESINEN